MEPTFESLSALNVEIGERETSGDVEYFDGLLAPAFAMHRASGQLNGREEFLAKACGEQREKYRDTFYCDSRRTTGCSVLYRLDVTRRSA